MINSDYANGVTRTAPLTEVQAGEAQQVRSAATAHEAAVSTRPQGSENKSVPTLPCPSIPFDTKGVTQMVAQLDSAMDMMSLLFKLARQAREEGLQVRDIENKLVISSQQAQVDEMRHGAKLMIAMAVVSGVMAGFSAIMGGISLGKGAKAIKQQQSLDGKIAGREALIDAKVDSLSKQGQQVDRADVGKVWKQDQVADSNAKQLLDKKFDRNTQRGQVFNSVTQSVGQMSNSAVQVAQGDSQANAKEDEVEATISQTEKQKAEDNMSFNANFMKDLLQLMQQYSQSQNQAWKAAFGVA
ncbi:type III secretion system translocon subunit AopD [Aeromonas veronii]|uniref:type III secretion system translocon subunit AopD n=1 Tax=Aeromonas veronii TaxID=654 RepID=UPI0015E6BA32|nr:type III secretion system translocon subunit AopD [Aeromonas veronii]MBA2073036.1 AopD protein [Aeromonas veronii]